MKIIETCFLDDIPIDDDIKEIYKLEDSNKILPLLGWEPLIMPHRDDHCCEKMFNYLTKKESWIQYIPYDKTYALPYHSFFSKKQLRKLWKYPKELQKLNFCPFCGTCLNNEEIYELRIKEMDKYYADHKEEDESWIDFWSRLRHTKEGRSFFSDHWRKQL